MKKNSIQALKLLLILVAFTACNSEKSAKEFIVHGSLKELDATEVKYSIFGGNEEQQTAKVVDGKFSITGSVAEPAQMALQVGEGNLFVLYVENSEIQLELYKEKNKFGYMGLEGTVTGSEIHTHYKFVQDTESKFWDDLETYETLMADKSKFELLSEAKQEEITQFVKHFRAGKDAISHDFIKTHPAAYYSAVLSKSLAQGRDSKGIEELIAALDPSLNNTNPVKDMIAMSKGMVKDEVKLEDVFTVGNVNYKVDQNFVGEQHKGINYLASFSNNSICALLGSNEFLLIDSKGNELKKIKPQLTEKISSFAIDNKDHIYAMLPIIDEVEEKYRGKTFKRRKMVGVECVKMDANGKELERIKLEGALGATGSRVVDNKILVADYNQGILSIHDLETGKQTGKIKDMRQCCGILDFSVNSKNEILTANLGAFRVEKFKLNGEKDFAFGSRGRNIEQFHGCCNPVSVAGLSNGAIVTVEKDPTRIKIYSKTGASTISGISEMVKGCQYIPMIVDSNDNLYLASPDKGMVKCIADS